MLEDPLTSLKGLSPGKVAQLKKKGIVTCRDLLYNFPRRYLDRSAVSYVQDIEKDDAEVTIVGEIVTIREQSGRRRYLRAVLMDEYGGRLTLLWFQGIHWIPRILKSGTRLAVFGKVRSRYGNWSMVHPEMDILGDQAPMLSTGRIIALYPGSAQLTKAGLTSRTFRHVIYDLLRTRGIEIPEEILPASLVQERNLLNWRVALRAMHFPRDNVELNAARYRLKFEELFLLQMLLLLTRLRRTKHASARLSEGATLLNRFIHSLPFTLTGGQRKALDDIIVDTGRGFQMNRLLQGDVGSGKTVVAIGALLLAVGAGYQGAIMAPTEVLAEQHYKTLRKFLEPLDVHVCLLVGGQRKKLRTEIMVKISSGTANVVVGTHAVFQESVQFNRLGMVVIDEQHRFGVKQRASLQEKGNHPHVLLMTATPIPRSLALTAYGDLDLSLITELPAGRQPIKTRQLGEGGRSKMLDAVRREVGKGRQAYVIYPQVEESEKTDLKDAESAFRQLRGIFENFQVGLVHGKMHSLEKEAVMDRFAAGEIAILVATTVVEVGIDAPNATIMVIEHAERFGLSQLHQLRGRVGRGSHASYCILMADYRRSREARERLKTLTQTTDGFKISDKDLELRGSGDFFGTRQHGIPTMKVADVVEDRELIEETRRIAESLVAADPDLALPEHGMLRWYYNTFVTSSVGYFYKVG